MGHSFISRLRSYVRRSQCLKNFNLDEERFEFKFFARGGLRISHIVNSRNFLSFDIRPDVCFLQIGENDICSGDEHFIARNILSLASYLHEGIGISLVIIGQLFRRQPWASSADFNNKIVRVNNFLKAASDTLPGVHFWHHRGFWSNMDFSLKMGCTWSVQRVLWFLLQCTNFGGASDQQYYILVQIAGQYKFHYVGKPYIYNFS